MRQPASQLSKVVKHLLDIVICRLSRTPPSPLFPLAGSCLRVLVLGGSLTVGAGTMPEREKGESRDKTNYCTNLGTYRYSHLLEGLLNEQFPCKAELPTEGAGPRRQRAHKWSHHRPRHRNHSGDGGDGSPEHGMDHGHARGGSHGGGGGGDGDGDGAGDGAHLTEAQLRGRHVVRNMGVGAVGTFHWVTEMARWMNSKMSEDTPFSDGVDLASARLLLFPLRDSVLSPYSSHLHITPLRDANPPEALPALA